MTKGSSETGYGVYWRAWLVLLALTLVMIFLDQASVSRPVLVSILLIAMLVKASVIGAYFMHLRFEKLSLALGVAVGLLVTGAILFFFIAPDAVRISRISFP